MTPMQRQYKQVKKEYPDALILFRLGDFYEFFEDDARKAAQILDITLTARGKGENKKAMAGIPYHALNNYLPKLVKAGVKAVIVDQVSEPQAGKIVEREVTDIITPGAIVDENLLTEQRNNFLAIVYVETHRKQHSFYLNLIDVGTNKSELLRIDRQSDISALYEVLNKYQVKELGINQNFFDKGELQQKKIPSLKMMEAIPEIDYDIEESHKNLYDNFQLKSLKGWGINDARSRFYGVVNATQIYLHSNLKKKYNLENLQLLDFGRQVRVPLNSYQSLEIFVDSQGRKEHTLFQLMDKTFTSMGRRKLESWFLELPTEKSTIETRLDNVQQLLELIEGDFQVELRDTLEKQVDYERILTRKTYNKLAPAHLYSFAQGIQQFASFQNKLKRICEQRGSNCEVIDRMLNCELNSLLEIAKVYEAAINPEHNDLNEPGFINPTFNKELEELEKITKEGKSFLKQLAEIESKRTGIPNLKVKFNKVFGYYLEVSKAHLDKVPEEYIRKQTLVNAERFITQELKEWEDKIINNKDKRLELEQSLFAELVERLGHVSKDALQLADLLSELDVYTSFALLAKEFGYERPELIEQGHSSAEEIYHPVLQNKLKQKFVPNSLAFSDSSRFQIITGPNMAGKSTYIRSIALLHFMAHLGSFVPAKDARIALVDGIYTRVGAQDNLAGDESTFMVEMIEMSYILKAATKNSLIILDEVGRGTSTYDGVALAWAIVEHLSQSIKAQTLFATHYHELIELEKELQNVDNYYVEVKVQNGELYFTHRVKHGSLSKSFGIAVAQMAGVDRKVISRAAEIQKVLEKENDVKSISQTELGYHQLGLLSAAASEPEKDAETMDILSKWERVAEIDLNTMTPLEVVDLIRELQSESKSANSN